MKCDHERVTTSINSEFAMCSDCGAIINGPNEDLKEVVNKLQLKNKELYDWIRDIENRNDKLTSENALLRKCLKEVL
ncbi:hypothetical protein H8S20_01630 [Clostridium sp. NSJ-6]|uniref:Transposase n=1 Tax=Clostridium hominis TaxID=2763036 RepID=A0ABR7D9M9_9CLOT|nr:hypothetical protein [Clostridium hominis]MBC5627588.1 hypothetical protein [Clostridium hominis]